MVHYDGKCLSLSMLHFPISRTTPIQNEPCPHSTICTFFTQKHIRSLTSLPYSLYWSNKVFNWKTTKLLTVFTLLIWHNNCKYSKWQMLPYSLSTIYKNLFLFDLNIQNICLLQLPSYLYPLHNYNSHHKTQIWCCLPMFMHTHSLSSACVQVTKFIYSTMVLISEKSLTESCN
jgi:hypothetical protein